MWSEKVFRLAEDGKRLCYPDFNGEFVGPGQRRALPKMSNHRVLKMTGQPIIQRLEVMVFDHAMEVGRSGLVWGKQQTGCSIVNKLQTSGGRCRGVT